MAAGVVQIPWYATLFRGDRFAEALGEIAPIATRYGATDYRVYRNRDDMYKFNQMATFEGKADFEAYWYGAGVQRLADGLLGLVPGADPLHLERPDLRGRPARRRSAAGNARPRASVSSPNFLRQRASPMWSWSSGVAWSIVVASGPQRLADARLHRGHEARLVVGGLELDLRVKRVAGRRRAARRRPRRGRSASGRAVAGFQARIVAIERSHAATSMSGGGVGATVNACGGMRAPAMSPTNALPDGSWK